MTVTSNETVAALSSLKWLGCKCNSWLFFACIVSPSVSCLCSEWASALPSVSHCCELSTSVDFWWPTFVSVHLIWHCREFLDISLLIQFIISICWIATVGETAAFFLCVHLSHCVFMLVSVSASWRVSLCTFTAFWNRRWTGLYFVCNVIVELLVSLVPCPYLSVVTSSCDNSKCPPYF